MLTILYGRFRLSYFRIDLKKYFRVYLRFNLRIFETQAVIESIKRFTLTISIPSIFSSNLPLALGIICFLKPNFLRFCNSFFYVLTALISPESPISPIITV